MLQRHFCIRGTALRSRSNQIGRSVLYSQPPHSDFVATRSWTSSAQNRTKTKHNNVLRAPNTVLFPHQASRSHLLLQRHVNSRSVSVDVRKETLKAYEAPNSGLLSYLPRTAVPYAELSRLDKPAGTYYLFFPCLFSTLLAAPLTFPAVQPTQTLWTTLLFFSGALIMRGAGCTINDLWDRNLDPQVARTRLRPIARGAIKPQAGLVYAGVQCLAGLVVLLQFPTQCLWYGIPSLLLVGTYPLAKRVTNYPQVVLGFAFSWGALMGFPASGIDLISNQQALQSAACLYASCISWTVLYDMIYAHMDIKDDVKAGIKSIALRHEKNTKTVLTLLAITQITLLGCSGLITGATAPFYVGSCGGAAITLGTMIMRVNLKEPSNCWWWFKYGCLFTGGAISGGLATDFMIRRSKPALSDAKHKFQT